MVEMGANALGRGGRKWSKVVSNSLKGRGDFVVDNTISQMIRLYNARDNVRIHEDLCSGLVNVKIIWLECQKENEMKVNFETYGKFIPKHVGCISFHDIA